MSHSYGAVRFDDGTIYHFEYNGTVDVCLPRLWKTIEEVTNHWREHIWPEHPSDCNKIEDVIMATTYGGGFGWKVQACKEHMLIVDGHSHEGLAEEEYSSQYDGLPDWYPDRERVLRYFE